MIADEQPVFGAGHNSGGLLDCQAAVEDLRSFLHERAQGTGGKTYAERRDEFLRSAGNVVIRNRAMAGEAADLIKLARQVGEAIEEERLKRSAPYRDTHLALKDLADAFWRPVVEAMDRVLGRIDAWQSDEDARIEAQRLEQEQEMRRLTAPPGAEPAPAPTPPSSGSGPKRRGIRGDYGGKVVRQEHFTYEVTDVRALPDFILNAGPVHDAIIATVKGMAKHTDIPGIKKTPVIATSVR